MPKPDYALPNGATHYLNGCDAARKIIVMLYSSSNGWTKAVPLREYFDLTAGEFISIARKLRTYELIETKFVDSRNRAAKGTYWKLSPGYRYGIKHYLDLWAIENGVTA